MRLLLLPLAVFAAHTVLATAAGGGDVPCLLTVKAKKDIYAAAATTTSFDNLVNELKNPECLENVNTLALFQPSGSQMEGFAYFFKALCKAKCLGKIDPGVIKGMNEDAATKIRDLSVEDPSIAKQFDDSQKKVLPFTAIKHTLILKRILSELGMYKHAFNNLKEEEVEYLLNIDEVCNAIPAKAFKIIIERITDTFNPFEKLTAVHFACLNPEVLDLLTPENTKKIENAIWTEEFVKKLPPKFFQNVTRRLKPNIYNRMNKSQIETFMTSGHCKFLNLRVLALRYPSGLLGPECFNEALENFKVGYAVELGYNFKPTKEFLENKHRIFSALTDKAFKNLNIVETVKFATVTQLADLAAVLGPGTMDKNAKTICKPFVEQIESQPKDIKAVPEDVIAKFPKECIQHEDVIKAMEPKHIRALGASLKYCSIKAMLEMDNFRTNMARGQLALLFTVNDKIEWKRCSALTSIFLKDMSNEGMADITPECLAKIEIPKDDPISRDRRALMINADVHRSVTEEMPKTWYHGLRSGHVKDFDADNMSGYCKHFRFDWIKPYHADAISNICFEFATANHPEKSPDSIVLEAEFYDNAAESLFDGISLDDIKRFKNFWTLAKPEQVISLVKTHKEAACAGFKKAHTRRQPAKITALDSSVIELLDIACIDANVIQDIGANINMLPSLKDVDVKHVMSCKECVANIDEAGLDALIDSNSERCRQISGENLNSMSIAALSAIFKECFWKIENIRRDLNPENLEYFPDDIFVEITNLPPTWYEYITDKQLKLFDVKAANDKRCKHLRLDKVAYPVDAQCFYNAIKNSAVRNLDEHLSSKADPDLFSHFGSDYQLLHQISKDSPFWKKLQEQHVEAILELIKDRDLVPIWNVLTDGFCTGFKNVHTSSTVDLVRKRDMSELQKLPVTCFTSAPVLEQLGRTRIGQLGRPLQDPHAEGLFKLALFKQHSTATQFEAIFSADSYAKCIDLKASDLCGVSAAVLGSIDSNCINQIAEWNFGSIEAARKAVPFLSPAAFSAIDHEIGNGLVFKLLSGAQIENFGKMRGERRGQFLDLENIQPYLAKHVDGTLLVNALEVAPALGRPFFKHLDPKAMTAVKDKYVIGNLAENENVLSMTTEQLDTLLKADLSLCHQLKAPPLGDSVNLPPIKTACFGLMDPGVQVDFLSRSELFAKLEDDALSALSPEAKGLLPKLRLIGMLRPKMLSFLGAKEGSSPCSQFTLKDAASMGKALTLLPVQCLRSFVGVDKLTIRSIQALPAPLIAAINLPEMLANSTPFLKGIRKDEWAKLTSRDKFCAALTADTLRLVNPSINALDVPAACFNELPIELLPQEQLVKVPAKTVFEASPAAIGKLKHLSPEHAAALDKNASGISSTSVLTQPALKAMSAMAIGSLQPAVFGKLDETQLPAIKPASLELVTKAQVTLLTRNALQTLSVEQADHIGKQIKDPEQDPRTFLQRPEMLELLHPEVQARLAAAPAA